MDGKRGLSIFFPMTSLMEQPQATFADAFDLVCFSHLRWDFVYQRPQHLLSRFAAQGRVFYFEEPVRTTERSHLRHSRRNSGVDVIVPHLSEKDEPTTALRLLIDEFFIEEQIHSYALWFYTPMHLPWTRHLKPLSVVYDCMDELSGFKGAPPEIKQREMELLQWADVVFTGGHSLYEAKREQHGNIYPFPSSIDVPHFARARTINTEPEDQARISGVRLGFFGVIDERMDLELIAQVAELRPEWSIVLVGPVVKIDQASLPKPPEHPLSGNEVLRRTAFLHRRLGRRPAAFRAQRFYAVHQSDEDAGISGSRTAGSVHLDPRRYPPIWRRRSGVHRRHPRRICGSH